MASPELKVTDIIKTARNIRKQIEENDFAVDLKEPNIYYEEIIYKGETYDIPLIILKSRPCDWFLVGGGCSMCGYQLASAGKEVTGKELLEQFYRGLESLRSPENYPFILISSSGSFFDPKEIGDDTRLEILRSLAQRGVNKISCESRPEYLVDRKRLEAAKQAFKGEISVGIGLESSDDFIRRFCVNKGYKTRMYFKAVEAVREVGISHYDYVLLGKPFLSPREDIEDAVETIKFAFDHDATMAALMVTNLQPHTLTYELSRRGLYDLPKLWAPLRVIELLPESKRSLVAIKGVDKAAPMPLAFARNCDKCTAKVLDAIVKWNYTRDYKFLETVQGCCDCKDEWLNMIQAGEIKPLQLRIVESLRQINQELR